MQYELEAVVEAALDLFRLDIQSVHGPEGEAFISRTSKREGLPSEDVRDELYRSTEEMITSVRRHVRQIALEEFDALARVAILTVVGLLPALAADRLPDFFTPPVRRDRRKEPIALLQRAIRERLRVGAPKVPPPSARAARDLSRLVEVGEELFQGVQRTKAETLAAAEARIRKLLDENELRAALNVLNAVRRGRIAGTDAQPKNLAFQFAADLLKLKVGPRSIRRRHETAKQVTKKA